MVLWKKFNEYDSTNPFPAWAIGVARLEVLSAKRKFSRKYMAVLPDTVDIISEAYQEMAPELEQRNRALKECVQKIRKPSRRLLILRYEKGMKPSAIAEKIRKKAGTVRVMLSRIRDALKECIENRMAASGAGGVQ